MTDEPIFYICTKCFEVCEASVEDPAHDLIPCQPGEPGSERRKPPVDKQGHVMTRAPLWYLEAIGLLPP